jgi:hypothetical protein
MTRKGPSWILATAVGVLALVGIAASATHYFWEPYNLLSWIFRSSRLCTWSWAVST